MDILRVRAYNVLFGDAILITVPDRDQNGEVQTRHILIDVGNVLAGSGGVDEVYQPIMDNVLSELDGQPLDLFVMTHEHMDHVQGVYYAERKLFTQADEHLRSALNTQHAWLTASAEADYYDKHPEAKQRHLQLETIYQEIYNYFWASPDETPTGIAAILAINNPRSTKDCVKYLRELAAHTDYVHRQFPLEGNLPFDETRFELWAPEEDTSEYYGRFQPMALGVSPPEPGKRKPSLTELIPPRGVDAGSFYNLLAMRKGFVDNLLAIDKAGNDSSVVFCLEWRGWRLLFPGDAEERSWQIMNRENVLKPVHFLKVSHHGSHNGTPEDSILEKILPMQTDDCRPRSAVVSGPPGTYNDVPDDETLDRLRERVNHLHVLHESTQPGEFLDIEFPDLDI
jgi:beta-lactamase superfamily II metal-dependent hydrolase